MWNWIALCVLVAIALWPREPLREPPLRRAVDTPTLERIQGLEVDPEEGGLPGFRAEVAIPFSDPTVVDLGGRVDGVELTDVRVSLGGDLWLAARRGRYRGRRLDLVDRVTVERGGSVVARASSVALQGERIVSGSLVVLHPGTDRQRSLSRLREPWRRFALRFDR